jgi:peptidoglycan/LPS O-acetylase OafA/YrhL
MTSRTAGKSLTAFDLMDATRALAAVAVLIGHIRNILFVDADAGLSAPWKIFYFATGFGHQAVMIFFVLSGYWITKTVVQRSARGSFAWSDYAIDRLSRLWVVLIPALLLGGIFDSIGRYEIAAPIYLGVQGTNTLAYDVATQLSLSNFAGSLTFVQTLLVKPFGSNGALWSLANEFWYYVWFPPLYLSLRGRRPPIATNLFVLITMAAFPALLPGFVCWLFGSLLFYATQTATIHTAPRVRMVVALAAAILLFCGVLASSRIPNLPVDGRIQDVAVSGSFALLLFVLIRSARTYPQWLTSLCRYGAGSSYSLYVVHFPLVVLLAALFVTPAHRLPPSGGLLLSFAVIAFVAIVFGYGLSVVTEANTSKLRRLLKKKYTKPATVPPIKIPLRDDMYG